MPAERAPLLQTILKEPSILKLMALVSILFVKNPTGTWWVEKNFDSQVRTKFSGSNLFEDKVFACFCGIDITFLIYLIYFSNLRYYISKTINRSDIKLSLACFMINFVQSYVSLLFLGGIFMAHSVPEVNSVTPIGKIALGQTGPMALIGIG